jgi:hypothetical protein
MLIFPNRTVFNGTRLFISDLFSPLKIAIDLWDENLKIEIVNAGFDSGFDPQIADLNLLDFDCDCDYGDGYDTDDNPVGEFLKSIPVAVRRKVRRFKFQQLQLLQLLSVIDDEDEALKDENLILLWLLIGRASIIGMDRATQLNILEKGYENILEQLHDKPHLSIFDINKVSGAESGRPEFEGLEFVIKTGSGFEVLTHLDVIPIRLPRLMAKYPKMSDSKLLYNIFKSKRDYLDVISAIDPLSKIWMECLSIGEVLRLDNLAGKLNRIDNQNALYKTRERWLRDVENLNEFSEPPIEGTAVIIPIRSPIELFTALGPEHYLGPAYIDQVNQGSTYFYGAKIPDEVIIRIDIDTDGGHKLGDIWSSRGGSIESGVRMIIEEWFEEQNGMQSSEN